MLASAIEGMIDNTPQIVQLGVPDWIGGPGSGVVSGIRALFGRTVVRSARTARGAAGVVGRSLEAGASGAVSEGTAVAARYTIGGHAADQMAARGVSRAMVDAAIRGGAKYWDPKNKVVNYVLEGGFASGKDLLVGLNPGKGLVTTVIRGSDLVAKRFIPIQ